MIVIVSREDDHENEFIGRRLLVCPSPDWDWDWDWDWDLGFRLGAAALWAAAGVVDDTMPG